MRALEPELVEQANVSPAISATVYGPGGVELRPTPRLSNATTRNSSR